MFQKEFVKHAARVLSQNAEITGIAIGGSWISDQLDEFSDVDLVIVTENRIGGDKEKMTAIAASISNFISGFTGEHVGEPRLLICLYDDPLIHVDFKFVTIDEFSERIEDPEIVFERNHKLSTVVRSSKPVVPKPDLQWIEDRFWTWVHYVATKIGRGEYFEALSALDFLRSQVLSPLMNYKNQIFVSGIRRAESRLPAADLESLKITVADYNRGSISKAMDNIISIYKTLRRKIFSKEILFQTQAENRAVAYFKKIKNSEV